MDFAFHADPLGIQGRKVSVGGNNGCSQVFDHAFLLIVMQFIWLLLFLILRAFSFLILFTGYRRNLIHVLLV